MTPPRRFAPDRPLPPYTFVPGRAPHPTSDPAGHRFGVPEEVPPRLEPSRWQTSGAYLFGLDLFNAGFYWEAHVELEGLWLAEGRRGVVADFLKGLIKLAAAGVKHLEGRPAGVRSHAGRAAGLWREVCRASAADVFLGLRLAELIALAEAITAHGWPEEPPLLALAFTGPDAP
jgi:hypothetical protein